MAYLKHILSFNSPNHKLLDKNSAFSFTIWNSNKYNNKVLKTNKSEKWVILSVKSQRIVLQD